jgi:hypothetical protein
MEQEQSEDDGQAGTITGERRNHQGLHYLAWRDRHLVPPPTRPRKAWALSPAPALMQIKPLDDCVMCRAGWLAFAGRPR